MTYKIIVNVLLFYKNNRVPLGSDYTMLTDIKENHMIEYNYSNHIEHMQTRGYDYIIIPYNTWIDNTVYKNITI